MKKARGARLVSPVLSLLFATGCASNEARDRMVTAHGLETAVTGVVELGKAPADPAEEVAAIEAARSAADRLLASGLDPVLAKGIARFDAERTPEQTRVERAQVEAEVETPQVRAEAASATRQELAGKIVRFRFTVRRGSPHVERDPARIEVPLTVLEDSRAPADTLSFPQDVRAELLDALNAEVARALEPLGCQPRAPRKAPTR